MAETCVYLWLIHADVWQRATQYCKAIIPQLKKKKAKIMTSGPITSWQAEGEKVEAVTNFIFMGSIITVDGDCSHEIKRLAPWKEIYDKPSL